LPPPTASRQVRTRRNEARKRQREGQHTRKTPYGGGNESVPLRYHGKSASENEVQPRDYKCA